MQAVDCDVDVGNSLSGGSLSGERAAADRRRNLKSASDDKSRRAFAGQSDPRCSAHRQPGKTRPLRRATSYPCAHHSLCSNALGFAHWYRRRRHVAFRLWHAKRSYPRKRFAGGELFHGAGGDANFRSYSSRRCSDRHYWKRTKQREISDKIIFQKYPFG